MSYQRTSGKVCGPYQNAPPAQVRTMRRWPVSLGLAPWWDDPAQAACFLLVAGVTRGGGRIEGHQCPDLSIIGLTLPHRWRRRKAV
jgi:hypothetical protein